MSDRPRVVPLKKERTVDSKCIQLIEEFLERARRGEVDEFVIAYTDSAGGMDNIQYAIYPNWALSGYLHHIAVFVAEDSEE